MVDEWESIRYNAEDHKLVYFKTRDKISAGQLDNKGEFVDNLLH